MMDCLLRLDTGGGKREAETHGQMDDLVVYRLLLRHLSHWSITSHCDCLLPLALT